MEEHKAWLRKRYRDAPLEGYCAKKVKFSDVFEELEKQFAPSTNIVSQAIKEVFPQSCSKPSGKLRHKLIFGIEPVSCDTQMTSSQLSCNHAALLEIEQTKNRELQEQVQQLEQKVSEMTEVLDHQMGSVLRQGHEVVDGPDTLEHFIVFQSTR